MADRKANPADGLVIYQLFLRMFTPEGTLKSAEAHLARLAELGVDVVYLCPVAHADEDADPRFHSPRQKRSGTGNPKNPYRIMDYYAIDPEYGTDEDLASFVRAAHALGMRVMLDLVYYHCGPKVVFLAEHPDFIVKNENGEWCFPKLNYENPALREYLWNNMTYFVEKFDVDGYRCDVGDRVPLDFWREGARRCRALKPGFLMLNEGDKIDRLDGFDVNYWDPYSTFDRLMDVLLRGADVSPLAAALVQAEKGLPDGKYVLRALDNHDKANEDSIDGKTRRELQLSEDAMLAAHAFCFTVRGVPFLYNGCEFADTGLHTIFANRVYGPEYGIDRSREMTETGKRRFAFLKELIRLHHSEPALAKGSEECIPNSAPDKFLTFLRRDADETVLCVIGFSKEPSAVTVPCGAARAVPLFVHNASFTGSPDRLTLNAAPCGFGVFRLN